MVYLCNLNIRCKSTINNFNDQENTNYLTMLVRVTICVCHGVNSLNIIK
jgi:hypothetical protein